MTNALSPLKCPAATLCPSGIHRWTSISANFNFKPSVWSASILSLLPLSFSSTCLCLLFLPWVSLFCFLYLYQSLGYVLLPYYIYTAPIATLLPQKPFIYIAPQGRHFIYIMMLLPTLLLSLRSFRQSPFILSSAPHPCVLILFFVSLSCTLIGFLPSSVYGIWVLYYICFLVLDWSWTCMLSVVGIVMFLFWIWCFGDLYLLLL